MFDPLDPNKIIGDLAQSWQLSADGKVYTFALVKNAKFHDGKPLTSADVKFTFDTMRNPPSGIVSARKGAVSVVETIEAPDDYTVRFVLKQPTPSFLDTLASGWMVILPKHVLEKGPIKDTVIGSGPFMLKTYSHGVSVELVKNPNYHIKGRPYLDGIKAFIIPDQGTTYSYLKTGQLHIYVSIQGQEAGQFKSQGDVVVLESPSTSVIGVTYNARVAPFDKLAVRKAASLAIDRAAALEVLQKGQGVFGGAVMPGPWSMPTAELEKIPGYSADHGANLVEARRLLAEAGYPNGLTVKLLVRRIALFEPVGIFIKDQWAKIGINVTLDVQENAAFFAMQEKREFQGLVKGGSFNSSDPDEMRDTYNCKGGNNESGFCSPDLDTLFEKMSGTLDPVERKKLANQWEKAVLADYGVYYMYWRKRFMGHYKTVNGLVLHPNIDNNFRMQDLWLSA